MGSNVAPSFANAYMIMYEHKFLYEDIRFKTYKLFYCRYIDDLFIIWGGPIDIFLTLIEDLNSNSTPITFTYEFSTTSINYLDVLISIRNNHLTTTIYQKPTDRNNVLHSSSFHPPSLKFGLPHSQMLRIHRINSESELWESKMDEMINKFVNRGYQRKNLLQIKERLRILPREDTLVPTSNKQLINCIPMVNTYTTASRTTGSIIKKFWPIITSDPDLTNLRNFKVMPSYRRGRNLRDILIKTDISHYPQITQKKGCYSCATCPTCRYTDVGTTFSHPHTGKRIPINHYLTCNTRFVVYIIKCPCGKYYVGKTSRTFKERMALHRSAIRAALQGKASDQPVARHFLQAKHNLASLRHMIIDHIPVLHRGGDRDRLLQQREAYWIHRLNTLPPNGLNEMFSFACFL